MNRRCRLGVAAGVGELAEDAQGARVVGVGEERELRLPADRITARGIGCRQGRAVAFAAVERQLARGGLERDLGPSADPVAAAAGLGRLGSARLRAVRIAATRIEPAVGERHQRGGLERPQLEGGRRRFLRQIGGEAARHDLPGDERAKADEHNGHNRGAVGFVRHACCDPISRLTRRATRRETCGA